MTIEVLHQTSPSTPLVVFFLPDEAWYPGDVIDGLELPLTSARHYTFDLLHPNSTNQLAPAWLSTKGRVLVSEAEFLATADRGQITIIARGPVKLITTGGGLKQAQQALAQQTFTLGQMPPEVFFTKPQWNTWIELLYHQTQAGVEAYANGIIEHGFPAGIIMIDDLWAPQYGQWVFSRNQFPNASAMITQLHQKGFKVMVWVCPFVSPDSAAFRQLAQAGWLIQNTQGKPVIRHWWNGYSAVLDLSHPQAQAWLHQQLHTLQVTTGVDGFKFDAGDPQFYSPEDVTYGQVTPLQQTQLWGEFAMHYPYNEMRANYRNQGAPLVNRLQDKAASWDANGLAALIPDTLIQGLFGYYFSCPDMIGGGEYESFLAQAEIDQELVVRFAQCAALMPMMQFSAAPWRVLDDEHLVLCRQAVALHQQYCHRILALAECATTSGQPIVLGMDWIDANTPPEFLHTQFMLGETILVAPVLTKGATSKTVYLPAGRWQAADSQAQWIGPQVIDVAVNLTSVPIFLKQ